MRTKSKLAKKFGIAGGSGSKNRSVEIITCAKNLGRVGISYSADWPIVTGIIEPVPDNNYFVDSTYSDYKSSSYTMIFGWYSPNAALSESLISPVVAPDLAALIMKGTRLFSLSLDFLDACSCSSEMAFS